MARAYGLSEVQILRFPAQGTVRYGTQRSRQAWDAAEGEPSDIKDAMTTKIAIADESTAEYGPLPLALVVEYLREALKTIGVVEQREPHR